MEQHHGDYIAYSLQDMVALLNESSRLNKGNGLKKYLKKEGYIQEGTDQYYLAKPEQRILLSSDENGISYVNLLDKNDKGMFIQFLQNRMLSENYIVPNQEIYTLLSAISMALQLEKSHQQTAIKPRNTAPKKPRKHKGL